MAAAPLTNAIFRAAAPQAIRHVQAPDLRRATGLVGDVCRQMMEEFENVPPITLHHSLPRVMAGLWAASREAYVADQPQRALREMVAASVSHLNRCPYCVEVHGAMLRGLGDEASVEALDGRTIPVRRADEAYQPLLEWAAATLTPAAPILRRPPFDEADAPKFIGTALLFHYINRMVSIFLDESPLPIPDSLGWLKRPAGRLFGKTVGRQIATRSAGAESFPLANEAACLPEEFRWAQSDPRVAAGFSLFAHVVEEAGTSHVAPAVAELVERHLGAWHGEAPSLGHGWLESEVGALPQSLRSMARLALLAARVPYQVSDADVAAFRRDQPSDADLIAVTSWASFRAMKRISSWLHAPTF